MCVSSAGAALPGQLFAGSDQAPHEVPCSLGRVIDRVSEIWIGDGHLRMELSAVEHVSDREPQLHGGKAFVDRAGRALVATLSRSSACNTHTRCARIDTASVKAIGNSVHHYSTPD